MASLPKYFTVSKLSSESTDLVLASVSEAFIDRRIEIRQSEARTVNQMYSQTVIAVTST
jgi:hypothetical protein